MNNEISKKFSYNLVTNNTNYIESFRENIYIFLKESDITIRELAEKADIPFDTLKSFLYRKDIKDCKLSFAVSLAKVLEISIDELIGAEVLDQFTRERLAICRNLPKHSLYLVQWFIREQKRLSDNHSKTKKIISVMQPHYVNGRLNPTNVFEPLNIDLLSDNVKSKVFIGIRITCEDYMPHYSPYDTLLLANDREAYPHERCVILYYGKILIVTKTEKIKNNKKVVEYVGIRDKNIVINEKDIDTIIGYIVCTYNL